MLLAAYDREVRPAETAPPPPGAHAERDGPLVRLVGQHRGFVSPPPDLRVRGAALDALIARQRDFFAARGEAVEWKARSHDRPRDIGQRLIAAGFVPEAPEAVMIGVAAEMAGHDAPLPTGVGVRQTADETDMRRIAAMESAVWGEALGWLADDLIGRSRARPDQIAVLVAEAGDAVVSAAWLVHRPGTAFAALWGGSTVAPWRGRGIYRHLVTERARLAVARGVRYLQVDASDQSRPVLERLGFVAVTTTTPYVWTPPA